MPDTISNSGIFQAMFAPRTIALVGASADIKKNNARPQRFLTANGYTGRILPINPGRSEILGERAYPDLRAAPGPIDHAFIMVPAPAVAEVIDQCCELKIPVATIFSAGFAEVGAAGQKMQSDIVAKARAGGVRLIGPNCMGLINVPGKTPLTVNAVLDQEKLRAGPLSVISQSGSMLGTLITRGQARGLGFSKLVSVGNECDLGVGEIADLLVDDPETGVILLFLETFRDSAQLAHAARRAFAAGKPVIAYKLGRSDVGRRAAASHTGAMVGTDDTAKAFFRAHGIMRVDMMETLFELPQLVLKQRPPAGRRVAVVTGTGGAAAMVADRLGVLGADVVPPSSAVIEKLRGQGIAVSDAVITDIPMGGSERGAYTAILSALLASDHCDAVVSVIGSSSLTNPNVIADRVLKAEPKVKPLAVYLAPRADNGLLLLQEHGVASFRTPEACADAVNTYLNWRAPAAQPAASTVDTAAASKLLAASEATQLNELQSLDLFAALGINCAQSVVLSSPAQRVDMQGPFALKLLSADILHKTDAGMVRLNVDSTQVVATAQELLTAAAQRFPKARVDGVLVQRMERGLVEVIVGYRNDPEVGPTILLGMGGVMAELKRSFSVRLAPVSMATAQEMMEEIAELAILRGYRNLPRGDCAALARAVCALSLLACVDGQKISEAEINPLIVKAEGGGVVAVDGLVVRPGGTLMKGHS
ncbi:MAG: acetate--CoA ligase family protein [Proteobacteria bacterium]|nr:acetate--CoA ligase family protein [Pseudomonadota bacterium]